VRLVAINLGLFKLGWVAVVFSAAAGSAELGVATIAVVLLVHLFQAKRPHREALLMLAAGVVGLVWATLLVQFDVLSYPASSDRLTLAPYWIVAMWMLFATTLNLGMAWLRKHLVIAATAGAIGGPLSFLAGQKAGAVAIADGGLIVIAVGWAVLLPLISIIAARLNGFEESAPTPEPIGENQ